MRNRKYVKLQGIKTTGAAQVLSPGSWGFVITMKEQPPVDLWALPAVSVPLGFFTQSLWNSLCKKAWQPGDGCAQAPKAWRPRSDLIRRCARDPWRYNKLVWFASGLRARRKKRGSCIIRANLHLTYIGEWGTTRWYEVIYYTHNILPYDAYTFSPQVGSNAEE